LAHGRRPWARMVDETFMGDIARPPMVFSGARAVSPPQPPRGERPPTIEGANGQNTTPYKKVDVASTLGMIGKEGTQTLLANWGH
jgi:hypothetical protein